MKIGANVWKYLGHFHIYLTNKAIKDKILESLGVSADIKYDEFCRHFGFMTRKELLEKIGG